MEASSEKGIDGNISIESPDAGIIGSLTLMPSDYIDAARWMLTPCGARTAKDTSRFVISGPDAVPSPSDDLHTGLLKTGTDFSESDGTSTLGEYLNLADHFGKEIFSGSGDEDESFDY